MTLALVGRLSEVPPGALDAIVRRGAKEGAPAWPDVSAIERDVRARGDAALRELTATFDKVTLAALEVPRGEWLLALQRLPSDVRDALATAKANIERYHRAVLPQSVETEVTPGLRAGRRIVPLRRVGVYVPGGRAAYPSTVLMCAVPAKVAGVREIVVCTPPPVADATLAACSLAGVDRVFTVGGAQAVFALAFGTQSVPRVDKIVGPGNAFVAAAKARVAGEVAIDAPAGPSEVLVLCDAQADPEIAAREMLAQAEHDPAAACVCVSTDDAQAQRVRADLEALLKEAPRGDIVRAALAARGAVLVAREEAEACAFADRYAPEHVVLLTRDPRATLAKLSDYGSAFLGPWSGVALGDYCSGPNHVLPTMGLARSYSGLSVDDFLRRPTHQEATRAGFEALAPVAERLATLEGLPNHAASLRARRERP
jgi:histidinol dehydrogenase